MSYCTQTDIATAITDEKLIDLTDDAGSGSVVAGVVTEAIGHADGLIDSYVSERYAVPLSPVPSVIKSVSVTLAIYWLYRRRREVPDHITQDRDRQLRLLQGIADGKVNLGAATETSSGIDGAEAIRPASDRIFDTDSLEDF